MTEQVLERPIAKTTGKPKRIPGPRAYRGDSELWDFKDQYLEWLTASGFSVFTIKGAHSCLSWFFRHVEAKGIDRLADITPEVLEAYSLSLRELKNGQPASVRNINYRLIALKGFFRWLLQRGLILFNPAEELEVPKLPQDLPHLILTQREVRRLLDAPNLRSPVGYRDKAVLELFYATGIRTLELLTLKVMDIDVPARVVRLRQGKNRKDRAIPVPAVAMGYVREYIEKIRPSFVKHQRVKDDGTLFLNYTGGKMTKDRLTEFFRRNVKLAGLNKHVTAMTLRHSIASHLLENGMDVRYIQELLGHEKLSTTQVYTKVTLTGLRKHFNKHHPREKREK